MKTAGVHSSDLQTIIVYSVSGTKYIFVPIAAVV